MHKKLEEELPMVEVVVKVKTAEERFALQYVVLESICLPLTPSGRILNMIANLKMLVTVGTCVCQAYSLLVPRDDDLLARIPRHGVHQRNLRHRDHCACQFRCARLS